MKAITIIEFLTFIFLTLLFNGCSNKVKPFSESDLKWIKPFSKSDTVIFKSDRDERDTIIFYKAEESSYHPHDIERGFYYEHYMTVQYKLTNGSYHQFADFGDHKEHEEDFVKLSNCTCTKRSSNEMYFLGLQYDDESLQKISIGSNSTILFNSSNANLTGVNVVKGINSFVFSYEKGIQEYTDERNIHWVRLI